MKKIKKSDPLFKPVKKLKTAIEVISLDIKVVGNIKSIA
jgi:hypothetical protein